MVHREERKARARPVDGNELRVKFQPIEILRD